MGNGGNIEKPPTEAEEILRQNLYVEQIVSAVVILYEENKVTQKCFSLTLYLGRFYLRSLSYLLRLVRIARLDATLATKSLRKQILALTECIRLYQSGDPTPERRKAFRALVKMSGPDVQSARFLLSIVNDCEKNEELLQYCQDKGLIDRETFDFYLEPENASRLRDEIKELSQLRKQANGLLKGG
jgi:hypothetical protein